MLLMDVNVWVHAHREDASDHERYRRFVENILGTERHFGVSPLVLSGFIRIVTHPKVFDPPSPPGVALHFAEIVFSHPNAVIIRPGGRHWSIFIDLCRKAGAVGNLVPDAYFAALAMESGSTWVSTDRDYGKFPDLDWKHPLNDF